MLSGTIGEQQLSIVPENYQPSSIKYEYANKK